MVDAKETIMDWLRDAHAMEVSLVSLLERQSASLNDKPSIQMKLNEHIQVTKEQEKKLEALIKKMGGSTSGLKEGFGKLFANFQGLTASAAPDAVVKNALAGFAVESFEIACYRSLIAAADAQGLPDVKRVCQEILDQEVEMANWFQSQIPHVTTDYLQKSVVKKA
ncbi:MAG: hypothetical protein QOE90_3695 [Thermoplasmata archaeon]|jgi:ferritin-like metal-binding protein YciE|nr:hypothetical protein [Thermoplasmata archaeon]